MICVACKKEITDGSVFCNFCKFKQTANAVELSLDEMLEKIQDLFSITGYSFSETGILNCKKWIREFGFEILCESIETALSQYLVKGNDGKYTEASVDEVFSEIGGIAKNKHNAITKPSTIPSSEPTDQSINLPLCRRAFNLDKLFYVKNRFLHINITKVVGAYDRKTY